MEAVRMACVCVRVCVTGAEVATSRRLPHGRVPSVSGEIRDVVSAVHNHAHQNVLYDAHDA